MRTYNMRQIAEKLESFPHIGIGDFPSPVRKINLRSYDNCWVKDDGICALPYGGNKIRKLEFLLADALGKNMEELIVHGDTGSHNVISCSIYGIRTGFKVTSVVFPMGESPDADIDRLKKIGSNVIICGSMLSSVCISHIRSFSKRKYLVPLGASSPFTTLGYVKGALELCRQINENVLPCPDKIYLPCASGGTVAGILIGIALSGLDIKIVAVRTADRIIANERRLASFVKGTCRILSGSQELCKDALECLDRIESSFLGRGYRSITEDSKTAVAQASADDLLLDPYHSGKAFAAMLDDLRNNPSMKALFWNTHSRSP